MATKTPSAEADATRVNVRILDKDYFVACPAEERSDLIRDTGKVVGADRIAVMAALNIANELLRLRDRDHASQSEVGTRVRQLRERVETALQKGQQLDL